MFAVFYELAGNGRNHAKALGTDVHRVYLICGVVTLAMWLLYPIAWGVCEGGNVIPPDSEAVFYGVLDVIAKPVSLNHTSSLIGKLTHYSTGLQCCAYRWTLEYCP